MNKKFVKLIIVLAAVIIAAAVLYNTLMPSVQAQDSLSAGASGSSASSGASASASKTPASDFTVYDASGNKVKLSDFKGKPVVINFWATWCPYCREELPYFETAYQANGSKVQFMMIDVVDGQQETKEKGAAYIKSLGSTFPVFYDTDLNAVDTYGIQSFPTTIFVDSSGNLAAVHEGLLDQTTLNRGIALITPQ